MVVLMMLPVFTVTANGQVLMQCTNPLKDWTKLLKQFRTIKLGNYEKREKVFQS